MSYILNTLAAFVLAALACRFGPQPHRRAIDIVRESRRPMRAWEESK